MVSLFRSLCSLPLLGRNAFSGELDARDCFSEKLKKIIEVFFFRFVSIECSGCSRHAQIRPRFNVCCVALHKMTIVSNCEGRKKKNVDKHDGNTIKSVDSERIGAFQLGASRVLSFRGPRSTTAAASPDLAERDDFMLSQSGRRLVTAIHYTHSPRKQEATKPSLNPQAQQQNAREYLPRRLRHHESSILGRK